MDEDLSVDLNIFDGLEGFEEFNPMDDSSLVSILDDLEEGTLLSLLGDENLLNDVGGELKSDLGKHSGSCEAISDFLLDGWDDSIREQPVCDPFISNVKDESSQQLKSVLSAQTGPHFPPVDHLPTNHTSNIVVTKRPLQDYSQVNSFKRAKLDIPASDSNHLLLCVQHDHCYVPCFVKEEKHDRVCEGQRSPIGSSSDEEGSLSDAGYDTMSSSTSPGNNSTLSTESSAQLPHSTPTSLQTASPKTPSTINHLVSQVDPVALIDARIQHFMCSREVNLTEEEKETLKGEGLPIPTTLPLTKAEEKALRGVRRKIRNKVAAQESRKRKKEHLVTLEDRCKQHSGENYHLKRKVEALESENKSLQSEVKKLRELLSAHTATSNSSKTTRVGACLMVMVLCFAIFFGSITPNSLWPQPNDYTTSSVRSRSLLSVEDPTNFQSKACNWFKQIFMLEKFSEDEGYYLTVDHNTDWPPQLHHGPMSYYEHVYTQFSGYLNYSSDSCTIEETRVNDTQSPSVEKHTVPIQ